jgi:PAS domain S-box-containing protein
MCPSPDSTLSLAFEAFPEPLAILRDDAIDARNAAWRAQLGEASSLRACIDPADHPALADALTRAQRGRASLTARLAGTGDACAFTLWPAGEAALCVRLDDPPRAAPPAEPISSKERVVLRMFDSIDACVWAIRRDGTITLSEGNALAHYGLKPGQTVGLNAFQIYPEGSVARRSTERTLAGERVRNELLEKDVHWVEFTEPVRGEDGTVEAMVGLVLNVKDNLQDTHTARHLMEVINTLPLLVWAMDADGTSTLSAGKALDLWGLAPGQVVGQNLFDIYRDNLLIQAQLRQVLAGEDVTVEMEMVGRTWRVEYHPSRNGLGEVVGVYAIMHDLTDRIQAEQRIREQLATIEAQQRAIAELISPVIEVWNGVLVVPLIGTLDAGRAALLTERLLERVVQRRAAFAILDLTGIDALDTQRAHYLVRILRSLELLGCTGLFSGLRPGVAAAMVTLDIEIPRGRTHPTLADALRRCLRSPALRA